MNKIEFRKRKNGIESYNIMKVPEQNFIGACSIFMFQNILKIQGIQKLLRRCG